MIVIKVVESVPFAVEPSVQYYANNRFTTDIELSSLTDLDDALLIL
jgi:hypothetical protein